MRYLVQVNAHQDSLIAADDTINTWAFESNSLVPLTAELDAIRLALFDFYTALMNYFSPFLAPSWTIKVYDIDQPTPRVPLVERDDFGPFSPTGSGAFPTEVAMCLSYRGVLVSGEPKGRRRGRVYLGPLSANAAYNESTGCRPSANLVSALSDAVQALSDGLDGSGVLHSVWSRTDDELYNVVQYWVDNAFDTQRRRGLAPTTKTLLPEA